MAGELLVLKSKILPYLSPALQKRMKNLEDNLWSGLEEIRLRINRPLQLYWGGSCFLVDEQGILTKDINRSYRVNEDDLKRTLASISENSYYAYEEDIKRGFITIPGGHRVGLAGQVVCREHDIKTLKDISSLCFRIAREQKGCARQLLPHIKEEFEVLNTLIISPPRCGKTTILRDLARLLAQGHDGQNIVIVDERSEIAGCYGGIPQLDVGIYTDVLDSCPKAVGMMMALRSLSPQIIITDEIGTAADLQAVQECLNAGVHVISSFHASSFAEVQRRTIMQPLLAAEAFRVGVLLSRQKGPGTIQEMIRWN